VLKADQGLAMPDFRSAERTFALLTQVAGRAGRADLPGRVFLEALDPEHPVLLMAQKQDYSHFYETELEDRKAAMYPPFCRLIRLLVRGVDESESERDSVKLGELLAGLPGKSTVVLGPAQAPIYRVNEQYRNHILIKTNDFELVHSALRGILPSFRKSLSKTYLEIDVDPVDLL
jgi:primosomal protein N' (replication factor Y)